MIVLKSRNTYNFVISPTDKKNKYSQADQGVSGKGVLRVLGTWTVAEAGFL